MSEGEAQPLVESSEPVPNRTVEELCLVVVSKVLKLLVEAHAEITEKVALIADLRAEIERHHSDFAKVAALANTALATHTPSDVAWEALRAIRGVVG